jgi:hypothetical protein
MLDVFTSSSQPWDKMDPKLQKHSHSPSVCPANLAAARLKSLTELDRGE